jgi:hypothetical protein
MVEPVGFPVVECFEQVDVNRGRVDVAWRFWCPYCEKWHSHGPVEGHRVAHCMDATGTPFENGYVLMLVGKWEDRWPRTKAEWRKAQAAKDNI